MYCEDILNNVSIEVLKKIQGEFGIEIRLSRGYAGEVWSENLSYMVDLLKGSVKKLFVCLKDNTVAEVYVLEKDEHRLVIRIAPTDKKLGSSRLVFELRPLVENKESHLETVNIPSNRYPKEKNMIKQEQGLPFDLEQLCNQVSNTCGSVHSLKETIRTITQNQELVDQLERQKKRYLLEVASDIVSNWNAAVEFRFSPDLPVESLFLHFPERSVDLNRHVVTFLNNCKLKYIYKTDVKEEHYLLSVELADKTYNVGIPINAVDYITILSAFGGRVDLKTLIAKFQ